MLLEPLLCSVPSVLARPAGLPRWSLTPALVAAAALLPSEATAQPCSVGPATTSGGVVLTFDDHAVDAWHQSRGLFDEYGVKATFFVDRFHALSATQKQKVLDLAHDGHEIASHTFTHGDAQTYTPEDYIEQQIEPQLSAMSVYGIHPRNFAYPFGRDVAATTQLLFRDFGFVRDTSSSVAYTPGAASPDIYVRCGDGERFVDGLGTDYQYGYPLGTFETAFDVAMCQNTNVVLYGHSTQNPATHLYYTDHARLRAILDRAVARGLTFRRMKDICRWRVASAGVGAWSSVFDSPRPFGEIRFADFDADGDDDAFRSNGRQWLILENGGGTFRVGTGSERWRYLNTSAIPFQNLAFGDFDGDRRTDVFRAAKGRWYVSWAGASKWQVLNHSNYGLDRIRLGDFDGDGRTDVFLAVSGRWYVSYAGTSRWTFVQTSQIDPSRFGFADLDGNGTTDVFVQSGGRWYISPSARGAWQAINTSGFGVADLAFADLDGDRCAEVLRVSGGHLYASWCGRSAWSWVRSVGGALDDLAFADLDGDGRDDVLRVAGD